VDASTETVASPSPAGVPGPDTAKPAEPRKRRKTPPRKAALQAHPAPVTVRRAAPVEPHAHPVVAAAPRRLTLWRDVSALLFGAVAIVLIAQLALGNNGDVASASATPGSTTEPTDVAVIGTGTPAPTSEFTIGPVIDPSLIPVIEATATPVPIITLPPTPVATARATPRPTIKPVATPRPSVAPTPAVTAAPSAAPTEAPPVIGTISCSQDSVTFPSKVTCMATVSGSVTSWLWSFGDAVDPTPSTLPTGVHTYTVAGSYVVTLTVTGPGGSSQDSAPSPIEVQ
jgi:hypothetical protein